MAIGSFLIYAPASGQVWLRLLQESLRDADLPIQIRLLWRAFLAGCAMNAVLVQGCPFGPFELRLGWMAQVSEIFRKFGLGLAVRATAPSGAAKTVPSEGLRSPRS
jgi:hypothetical protein